MKLYVGNLAYSTNDSTLRALFEPFGTVDSARVISDRDTGSSKGFGFVEMADGDAQKAMGALNGRELDVSTRRSLRRTAAAVVVSAAAAAVAVAAVVATSS